MKVMGIDFGDARTGIAISDLLRSIVGTTTVIHSRNMEKTLQEVQRLVQENAVGEIAVGLPKNMDGTEGARAQLCREFAQLVEQRTGLPVKLWDERRTTVDAHRILSEAGKHGKKRKARIRLALRSNKKQIRRKLYFRRIQSYFSVMITRR